MFALVLFGFGMLVGELKVIAVRPRVFPGQTLGGAAAAAASQFSAWAERSGQSEISCQVGYAQALLVGWGWL